MFSMAGIIFTDEEGRTGRITDELNVVYEGPWKSAISIYVDLVATEFRDGDGELRVEDAFTEFVVGLPSEAPLVSVEREERSTRSITSGFGRRERP